MTIERSKTVIEETTLGRKFEQWYEGWPGSGFKRCRLELRVKHTKDGGAYISAEICHLHEKTSRTSLASMNLTAGETAQFIRALTTADVALVP